MEKHSVKETLLALGLCALSGGLTAFPLWVDSPTRSNPHDRKSPLYGMSTSTPLPTMPPAPSPTLSPTSTISPTPSGTSTPTPYVGTPTITPIACYVQSDTFAGPLNPNWNQLAMSGSAGSAGIVGGALNVTGTGWIAAGSSDMGYFVHQSVTGDFDVSVKVNSVATTNDWAKAGIMVRQDNSHGAVNAFMLVTNKSGFVFQRREVSSGATSDGGNAGTYVNPSPVWLRLQRTGNDFNGYHSTDGVNWTQRSSTITLSMSATVLIGVAACSNDGASGVASFNDFTVLSGGLCSTPTITPTASPTGTPCAPTTAVFRLKSGGPAYTDVCGNVWAADQPYTPGGWGRFDAGGVCGPSATPIEGTGDDPLYYNAACGPAVEYRFDLAPGSYTVTVHFIEDFWTSTGSRVFSVAMEGNVVEPALDLYAVAGLKTAYTLSAPVTVPDSTLNLLFTKDPAADNPRISAIEIK